MIYRCYEQSWNLSHNRSDSNHLEKGKTSRKRNTLLCVQCRESEIITISHSQQFTMPVIARESNLHSILLLATTMVTRASEVDSRQRKEENLNEREATEISFIAFLERTL